MCLSYCLGHHIFAGEKGNNNSLRVRIDKLNDRELRYRFEVCLIQNSSYIIRT